MDLIAFDQAIAGGDTAALKSAVSLYRGPLLEGCEEEWVLPERRVREQAYLQAREQLAQHALLAGDAASAIVHLRAAIGIDPLRESAQRGLMQALTADGDYVAAVQVYRELRLYLHRELNAEPDPRTIALFQQLRTQAKRQTQVAHPPPAAVPTATPPRRLPQPVSSLVGREQEIAEVSACLSAVRLLTLTGAGGVGKTRLAITVADAVADDYSDGVCFVDLAPLSDPALIPQTLASALEVREQPGKPLLQTLCLALQSKSLLLLLDNCEHLLEGCASVASSLLEGCRHLKILATSRQSLGITGELVWRVPSLPVPPIHALAAAEKEEIGIWLDYASVQLLVERAQLVSPAFRLNEATAQPVLSLCRRLDGIPLALELAAARLRALRVEQIAARLEEGFSLLTTGSRTAPTRQQTLRATLDWSYHLLTEPEQLLLRRLSVFAGGWTLGAAEQVCSNPLIPPPLLPRSLVPRWGEGELSSSPSPAAQREDRERGTGGEGDVLDGLTSLVDKSLVVFEQREREAEGRYRLLETVRQYAGERLRERGEEASARDHHLHYFLRMVEKAEPHSGELEGERWLERLETDHDNLRAALDWSLEGRGGEGMDSSSLKSQVSGLSLAGALLPFWYSGHRSEGRGYLAAALGHAAAAGRTRERARALRAAGHLAWTQDDFAEARALLEQSLAIYWELEDQLGMADALLEWGRMASSQGDYEQAKALYEQRLAICQELGDQIGIAWSMFHLGDVVHKLGDAAAGRALCEQGLARLQEGGNKLGISHACMSLGHVLLEQGDYAGARARYEQGLALRREIGSLWVAWSLLEVGHAAWLQQEYARVRGAVKEALGWFAAARNPDGEVAMCLESLAVLAQSEGDVERAARLFGAAEGLRERLHPVRPIGWDRPLGQRLREAAQSLPQTEEVSRAWKAGRAMTLEQATEYALLPDN